MQPVSRPLRVAVVNDFEVVVAGVAAMLAGFEDRIQVVELNSRLPVVAEVDLVLFDTFAHVTGDGVTLDDLVQLDGSRVVVYTWMASPHSIAQVLRHGVAGYLSKALPAVDLVKSLEDIHAGVLVINVDDGAATVQGAVIHDGPGDWPGRQSDLSQREAEVIALIARGLSNQEIAETLFLSINSVKTYVRTAYRKIDVDRRSQAVIWALEHGFAIQTKRSSPIE
jgi:NarL family two-component system response regulator LiaR